MQIGEAVAFGPPVNPAAPGTLEVTVVERFGGESVEGVGVTLVGPSGGSGRTAADGKASFSGLAPGAYVVRLDQPEFELSPPGRVVVVEAGASEKARIRVKRVMLTLVLKRIHIAGLLKALSGDKTELEYGHWWVEIDGSESYGWWPAGQVSIFGTFAGVPGALNGGIGFSGSATRDPHHGDSAEEMFHPVVANGKPAVEVKNCIRAFATGYGGDWSWPWGQNCHSFQEEMMEHCGLRRRGGQKAS